MTPPPSASDARAARDHVVQWHSGIVAGCVAGVVVVAAAVLHVRKQTRYTSELSSTIQPPRKDIVVAKFFIQSSRSLHSAVTAPWSIAWQPMN